MKTTSVLLPLALAGAALAQFNGLPDCAVSDTDPRGPPPSGTIIDERITRARARDTDGLTYPLACFF